MRRKPAACSNVFVAEARHLEQLVPRAEEPRSSSRCATISFASAGPMPGDVREQWRATRCSARRRPGSRSSRRPRRASACSSVWRDVVLVLPDADALRIDLHELGQRVLQAPRDRDRAAHREVEVRELLAGDVARAVDARARLAHQDARAPSSPASRSTSRTNASVSRPCRAVADGDARIADVLHAARRASAARAPALVAPSRWMTVVVEELAGVVDDGALAAGAQARVDAEHGLRRRTAPRAGACARSRRRRRSPPRRPTSLSALWTSVSIERRTCAFSAQARGLPQERLAPASRHPARRGPLERGEEPLLEPRVPRRVAEREGQLLLQPAAPHREVAVRRLGLHERGDRLAEVEVRLVLARGLRLLALRGEAAAARTPRGGRAGGAPRSPRGARPGSRRRPRARRRRRRSPPRGFRKAAAFASGVRAPARLPCPTSQSQSASGCEARLAGEHGLRLPLLLVREVEVLERRQVERGEEPLLQLAASAFPAPRSRRRRTPGA